MKLKTLFTLPLLFLVGFSHGQSNAKDPLALETYLEQISEGNVYLTYHRFKFTNTPFYNSYGIGLEAVFGKHIGVELGISAGKDNFETGLGILLLPLAIAVNNRSMEDPEDLGIYLVKSLMFLTLLEHVNYHIKINQDFQLIPYVSLLRMTYIKQRQSTDLMSAFTKPQGLYSGGAAGMKAGLSLTDKWRLNAFCEWSLLYISGHYPSGLQAGINLGIVLPQKEKQEYR